MSFRKRNIALSSTESSNFAAQSGKTTARGVRVSPVTAHPTVSTGTVSLDKLLSLGVGQALGTSLLIGEEGTTDFASALLRCYAAEALMHGHKVLVVAPEGWANSLPGVVEDRGSWKEPPTSQDSEKMKIAWRYERLGAHGEQRKPPGGWFYACVFSSGFTISRDKPILLHIGSITLHFSWFYGSNAPTQ